MTSVAVWPAAAWGVIPALLLAGLALLGLSALDHRLLIDDIQALLAEDRRPGDRRFVLVRPE